MGKQTNFCPVCNGNKIYIEYRKSGAMWVCEKCGEEGIDHRPNPKAHERKQKEVQL